MEQEDRRAHLGARESRAPRAAAEPARSPAALVAPTLAPTSRVGLLAAPPGTLAGLKAGGPVPAPAPAPEGAAAAAVRVGERRPVKAALPSGCAPPASRLVIRWRAWEPCRPWPL